MGGILTTPMIHSLLQSLGLDDKEISVFLLVTKIGSARASVLAYQSGLPRTTVQNVLLRLEKKSLINKIIEENTYIYSAISPENLSRVVEMQKQEHNAKYDKLLTDIESAMPELKGLISRNKNLPKVKFYKGREAVEKVLFDTLDSTTELKDFANVDAMFQHAQDINDAYVNEREKSKITKRSLLLDTPFAREIYESGTYSPRSHKGYKWIESSAYPFSIETNIYDGKVSYITYVEDEFIGVIIENQYIYEMHDSMWNLIWDLLP